MWAQKFEADVFVQICSGLKTKKTHVAAPSSLYCMQLQRIRELCRKFTPLAPMMDSSTINENICRICLQHSVILNWNEQILEFPGVSYKDCYYKYIKLEENDSPFFPTNLCDICSNELRNAHMLFQKALESFNILQVALTAKTLKTEYPDIDDCNIQPVTDFEFHTLDENESIRKSENDCRTDNKIQIEIEEEMCTSNVLAETENAIKKTSLNGNDTIGPKHFIDVQNVESTSDNLLLQQLNGSSCKEITELSCKNKADEKRSNKSLYVSTLEQNFNKSYDADLPKISINKKIVKKGKCKLSEAVQNFGESCDIKHPVLSAANQDVKTKKKYLLMCAYCSLQVKGITRLKQHEATHSEDRKRTETCPQCGIKLYTKLALTNHMKIHDENRQKRFKCEFCEKAFFNRGGLNIHRRIHLGLMVACPICSKEFYRQIDLNRHLPKHSATPPQKSGQKFKYTIQCQYCNKYVRTDKWKGHKAAHLGQPQVKCKICDKNFFARSNCVKHLKQLHHKSKNVYEEFIHYYVNSKLRLSHLIIKQEEIVKPVELGF